MTTRTAKARTATDTRPTDRGWTTIGLRRAAWTALGAVTALVAIVAGCAGEGPSGPPFEAAAEPSPGHVRLYVFRIDPQHSLSTVELSIDRRKRGRLRNGEYATFELPAGVHRVDVRQRGFAFASWGWNGTTIRAKDGETVYLEVSVRISGQGLPAGSGHDLEIGGRGSGSASENVFLQRHGDREGLRLLAKTVLRVED